MALVATDGRDGQIDCEIRLSTRLNAESLTDAGSAKQRHPIDRNRRVTERGWVDRLNLYSHSCIQIVKDGFFHLVSIRLVAA